MTAKGGGGVAARTQVLHASPSLHSKFLPNVCASSFQTHIHFAATSVALPQSLGCEEARRGAASSTRAERTPRRVVAFESTKTAQVRAFGEPAVDMV